MELRYVVRTDSDAASYPFNDGGKKLAFDHASDIGGDVAIGLYEYPDAYSPLEHIADFEIETGLRIED